MPRKVSIKQTNVLLQLMEDHPDMASARMISADDLKAFWDEATVALNAPSGGTHKTSTEWRIYWTDLKYRARKRAAAIQNDIILTGGVATSMRPLTSIENRVLAIIKKTEGNHNSEESPPLQPVVISIKQEKDPSDEESEQPKTPFVNNCTKRPKLAEDLEDHLSPDVVTSEGSDEEDLEPQVASKQTTIRYRRQRITDPRTWNRKAEERRMDLEIRRTRSLQLMQRSLHRMENSVGGLVQQIGQTVGCLNRIAQALENMQPSQWPAQ